jgi:hypothetical protein
MTNLASSSWAGVRVAIVGADGVAALFTHMEEGCEDQGEIDVACLCSENYESGLLCDKYHLHS